MAAFFPVVCLLLVFAGRCVAGLLIAYAFCVALCCCHFRIVGIACTEFPGVFICGRLFRAGR